MSKSEQILIRRIDGAPERGAIVLSWQQEQVARKLERKGILYQCGVGPRGEPRFKRA